MSNIRVDVGYTIKDGTEIKFRSPVDCSAITGLIVYYPVASGNTASKVFALSDANGNNVGDIDHLFAEDVMVKVILDVTKGMAFVQNADTNAYLEGKFKVLDNHASNKSNPHGVTAAQVGARPNTWMPSASDVGAVPTSRKVNNKALSSDISLTASDVGARANNWMPSASDVGAVPTSRTVNGKALSGNISLSASDVKARSDTWVPSASQVSGQTDYVVANGTSGVWTYWKFNSGLCIAMGTPTVAWGTVSEVIAGQRRSTTALDLTGIFTAVMGGTCSNVHRYVNCFVIPSGSTSAELWATTAASLVTTNNGLFSTTPNVVLFGKWK